MKSIYHGNLASKAKETTYEDWTQKKKKQRKGKKNVIQFVGRLFANCVAHYKFICFFVICHFIKCPFG